MTVDRYAVIGNPVAHALSPRIHAAFAEQTGESMSYGRLFSERDAFIRTVESFFAEGGCGLNVTVPFKIEAAAWATELDADAAIAGAVNTLVVCSDVVDPSPANTVNSAPPTTSSAMSAPPFAVRGFNTDGPGLVKDLKRHLGGDLSGLRILVVGAGGAVRGVLQPLLDTVPVLITIANRTPERAIELATNPSYRRANVALTGTGLDSLRGRGPFDLIINGTSAGLEGKGDLLPSDLAEGAFCYDMFYGKDTPFCRWARESAAAGQADGLGMLVEQAALGFELWRGILPDTRPVLARLREELEL